MLRFTNEDVFLGADRCVRETLQVLKQLVSRTEREIAELDTAYRLYLKKSGYHWHRVLKATVLDPSGNDEVWAAFRAYEKSLFAAEATAPSVKRLVEIDLCRLAYRDLCDELEGIELQTETRINNLYLEFLDHARAFRAAKDARKHFEGVWPGRARHVYVDRVSSLVAEFRKNKGK